MSAAGIFRLRAIALAAVGLALWFSAGVATKSLREREQAEGIISGRRSGLEAAANALGGFKGLAADLLWLRAIQMRDEGRHDEIALLCKLILELQPRFASAWSFHAWNMAYNIAFETNSPRERWRWIRAGLDLLEKEGVPRNPHSYALYWELGYMYFFRLSHKGWDPFYRYYQEELSPVPDWCHGAFEFVDKGLWSDAQIRYRLYRRVAGPGHVVLGGPLAKGGDPSRARKMYVLAVSPYEALASARAGQMLEVARLEPGTELYADAPDRVHPGGPHRMRPPWPDEPSIPSELSGAAVIRMRESDRHTTEEHLVELELRSPAAIWVGWVPNEVRNFEIARRWLLEAESKPDCGTLAVPTERVQTLRVHALIEMGEWESAYEEFLELYRARQPDDESIPVAFENFLLLAFYEKWTYGDKESAEVWHKRLKSLRPDWMMSPVQTAAEFERRTR